MSLEIQSQDRIAWIHLDSEEIRIEKADPQLLRLFLGGRGLGAALLFKHVADPTNPFHPENPLIFSAGALTGTSWPAGSRYHVTFSSPLTGVYGYANAGGFIGSALRQAGYLALVVTGQAKEPAILRVAPEGISIEAAGPLWGAGTLETHDVLSAGGARVACIGPAGENLVRFSSIINDRHRAAARSGAGAAMGAKRLKAIVAGGKIEIEKPSDFRTQVQSAARKIRQNPATQGLHTWGTVSLVSIKNHTGDLPSYNHQYGQVPFVERIDAEAVARYTRKTKSCFACPISCGRFTIVEEGPYAGELEGPEYETLDALGPMCGVGDLKVIMHANRMCDDMGLDSISTGVVVAFAMECHQRGILSDSELSLDWGDPDSLLGLIDRIAHRQGLGNVMAEGVRRAAQSIGNGASNYAMHVKGQELPRQEPRIAKGFGLGHATSNRGADHLYALPTIDLASNVEAANHYFSPEIVPELIQPSNERYKPDLVAMSEHYCAVSDALGVCKFSTTETHALYPEDLAAGLSAFWDSEISADDLMAAGERIVNLERLYNTRLGLSRADDRLPDRILNEPMRIYEYEIDPVSGENVRSSEPVHVGKLQDLNAMLDRYYQLRGWSTDGIPTPETLARLGLDVWLDEVTETC